MSFISVAVMFVLNIFKKLTNMKKVENLAVTVCMIIFVISLLINNVFTLEKIANAFYKYASLILIFVIFTLILIGANIKKKRLDKKQITTNRE